MIGPPARKAPGFSLLREGTLALGANGLTLAVTVVTGVLAARLLGAEGRGELTAIVTITAVIGWAFTVGCGQVAEYHQARRPEQAGELIGTWLLLVVVFGGLAALVSEALLPVLLAAQPPAALRLAQLFVLTSSLVPLTELLMGTLVGDHDFAFFNLFRVLQPAATGALYLLLWRLHAFTLPGALAATAASGVLGTLAIAVRALARHGIRRPDLALGRSTLWYGLRAHGTILAGLANIRLDLLIIPAFLAASAVGLYAVATSVSWVIVAISSNLASVVLAAASRQGESGAATIVRSLHLTLAVGLGAALLMALFADRLIPLVYGAAFQGSVLPLRLLLPGSALYAAATIVWSGLYAANRPFTATASQLVGLVVTVAGLLAFLRQGGIGAAALVSTAAYAAIFATTILLYRRAVGLEWRALLPSFGEVLEAGGFALRGARGRLGSGRVSRLWRV